MNFETNLPATRTAFDDSHSANVEPARKRKKKNKRVAVYNQTDAEVWDLEDEVIIKASQNHWTSPVYKHYQTTLQRTQTDTSKTLTFLFHCIHGNPNHQVHPRDRGKTGDGTSNLNRYAKECDNERGVVADTMSVTVRPFSEAAFRAMLALWCADSHRPFNMVQDKYFHSIIEMLRPSAVVPHPTTVSSDIKHLYLVLSDQVSSFLVTEDVKLHFILDGWTAPGASASWLGVATSFRHQGRMYRVVLEFIKLEQSHTGKYLAAHFVECLKQYKIDHLLFSLSMDNAGNCDTTAIETKAILPHFDGGCRCIRCFLHILNLLAKMFISFFFKQYKRKTTTTISKGAKQMRSKAAQSSATVNAPAQEILVTPGETLSTIENELAETMDSILEQGEKNPDVDAHDVRVVKTMRKVAIEEMEEQGIFISAYEQKEALEIFPKVAGLAQKVHDSGSLGAVFAEFVQREKEQIEDECTALARRVPTRWNGDFDCLESHVNLKPAVELLTAQTANRLTAYALTPFQWDLSDDLIDVLQIFKAPTEMFSCADVPLIPDVIPMMEDLETALKRVRDGVDDEQLPDVFRVAAHAMLLLLEKYFQLTDECEIYQIAIAMCPDRKLEWFKKRGWLDTEVAAVQKMVVNRFNTSYKGLDATPATPVSTPQPTRNKQSRFLPPKEEETEVPKVFDNINIYLNSPLVAKETIDAAGGYIGYWYMMEKTTPQLAEMGGDYCSAPASSVDIECAFSEGQCTINFMQHNMSSQTFRAQMAVASWDGTPLLKNLQDAIDVIDRKMHRDIN